MLDHDGFARPYLGRRASWNQFTEFCPVCPAARAVTTLLKHPHEPFRYSVARTERAIFEMGSSDVFFFANVRRRPDCRSN